MVQHRLYNEYLVVVRGAFLGQYLIADSAGLRLQRYDVSGGRFSLGRRVCALILHDYYIRQRNEPLQLECELVPTGSLENDLL